MPLTVSYSADTTDLDAPVREAFEKAPGKPINLRLQPTILRRDLNGGQQRSWSRVTWNLACETVEEAVAVREALQEFFDAVQRVGVEATRQALMDEARP